MSFWLNIELYDQKVSVICKVVDDGISCKRDSQEYNRDNIEDLAYGMLFIQEHFDKGLQLKINFYMNIKGKLKGKGRLR